MWKVSYAVRMGNNPSWSYAEHFADKKTAMKFYEEIKAGEHVITSSVQIVKIKLTPASSLDKLLAKSLKNGYTR